MSAVQKPKLYLNLYWHMHQPDYRDTITGQFTLPWTYLHAIKDYSDMAFHLEQNPHARVSFNFVPVLLDQLEDYRQQFEAGEMRDPLLQLLSQENLEYLTKQERCFIVDSCFKANHQEMLEPYEQYQRLLNIYNGLREQGATASNYLSGQYMADLLVWYHLAWMGESIKRNHLLIQSLLKKGSQFSFEERVALHQLVGEIITNLIPRYRALKDSGQIELSSTPHFHPILPLLLDFKSTRDAMPFAPLPQSKSYPGGRLRAKAHVESAQKSHLARFGEMPEGMWPAEGSVSLAALSLLAEQGVKWAATGEGVLANSLHKSFEGGELPPRNEYLYLPYLVTNGASEIVCFFRDDKLSDKIGFEYSKVYASEAVSDFVRSLEFIYEENQTLEHRVVSVILDGENAWEYFPYNGFYFLSELYAALSDHPDIQMTTFSEVVEHAKRHRGIDMPKLSHIAAGSWVYGTFSTWIGYPEKNRAWDLLCSAKTTYDRVIAAGTLNEAEMAHCERQLSICEGSDWFWWFGDYNSSESVESFDKLYRRNLSNLYRLLKQPVPDVLNIPISVGSGAPAMGGTMRRGQEN
jgi:alpha-amylase/alpha-mannosidase (GH57 family)